MESGIVFDFCEGDLLTPVAADQFDIVVSNPPYVPTADRDSLAVEVRDFEPGLALFAGEDGLDIYRRLIPAAFAVLISGGLVALEIGLFCGVCHSDLHMARNEWGNSIYPMVPGHEIVGRVSAAGSAVTKFKVGDIAAVGVIIDSCRHCPACEKGEEHFCKEGPTLTYAVPDRVDGSITMGGYSNHYVVDERFAHTVPANLDLAAVAPLLCAGITTYSPLRHWKVGPGMKVGIVGLGGLGHMGLKFAHSFGAHTVQLTTSLKKKEDALKLGADEVVLSTDPEQMKAHANSFDFILDTASAPHAPRALSGPA
jgi:uncharacterized zinc-type alcohol dehydrogenase-like protein